MLKIKTLAFYFPLVFLLMNPMWSMGQSVEPASCQQNQIWGRWKFVAFIHNGKTFPPANPDLYLEFSFFPGRTSEVRYWRNGQKGHCLRRGIYTYSAPACLLVDKVVWLDSSNRFDCKNDPDMILGQTSFTKLYFINGQMHTDLPLGDGDITYVWKRIEKF